MCHLDGCEESDERIEAEANHLAAYRLAPRVIVFLLQLETPDDIADSFGISINCACNVYVHYQKAMRNPRVKQKISGNRIAGLLKYTSKEEVA